MDIVIKDYVNLRTPSLKKEPCLNHSRNILLIQCMPQFLKALNK